jgi:hypothetical protein
MPRTDTAIEVVERFDLDGMFSSAIEVPDSRGGRPTAEQGRAHIPTGPTGRPA